MRNKIVAAGLVCVDITPVFPSQKTFGLQDFRPGQVVLTDGISVSVGGVVGNTGLGLKLLGADVVLMAKIGDDALGRIVLEQVRAYGADCRIQTCADCSTSYSVVLALPGTDRIFLHDPGANHTFGADNLDMAQIAEAQIFHFGYPPSMRGMFENDGAACVRMFEEVRRAGTATSLDMAMMDPASEAAAVDWARIVRRLTPLIDFFLPSVEELSFMIDRKGWARYRELAGGEDLACRLPMAYVRELADELMGWGAKVALIKCGARGLYLRCADEDRLRLVGGGLGETLSGWAGVDHFEPSYDPGLVRSSTGAGDACIAAFLYAVQRGLSWRRCAQAAAAAGAACVTQYDALSGLMPLDALLRKIDAGWEKVRGSAPDGQ
jgi:sugar/nucleoside kinase (ribokinase family)